MNDDDDVRAAREMWRRALTAPEWDGPALWLHGDLHPANVLVTDGALSGVIDFGEMGVGDPATDLVAAWLVLPDDGAFLDAYGGVTEATWRRALGWAALKALDLIGTGRAWERGLPGGKRTWGPAGRAALRRILASA